MPRGQIKPSSAFKMLQQNHKNEFNSDDSNFAFIQRKLKSGKWGKPVKYEKYGSESAQDVVNRLTKNNPGSEYRLYKEESESVRKSNSMAGKLLERIQRD